MNFQNGNEEYFSLAHLPSTFHTPLHSTQIISKMEFEDVTININETVIVVSPTESPTVENIDAAEETHQFDADAALLLNITLILCTLLVSFCWQFKCSFKLNFINTLIHFPFTGRFSGLLCKEVQIIFPTRVRSSHHCWHFYRRRSSPDGDGSNAVFLLS